MRQSVGIPFYKISSHFEGKVAFMYLDILGKVTTAIGILCDTKGEVRAMPWLRADGTPATIAEIDAEWDRVKARQDMKMRGGMAYKAVTTLHLDEDGLEQVVLSKLQVMEGELKKQYPDWEEWPADAQLGTLSMSWACGPWFGNGFKTLKKALLAQDWMGASSSCHMNTDGADGIPNTLDDNRGLIPRNVANKALFKNAAFVVANGLDPELMNYPNELDPAPAAAYDTTTIAGYQRALAELGYDVGEPDGVVGKKTTAAVMAFQTDHDLDVDGKVGPVTQHAMIDELQKRKA